MIWECVTHAHGQACGCGVIQLHIEAGPTHVTSSAFCRRTVGHFSKPLCCLQNGIAVGPTSSVPLRAMKQTFSVLPGPQERFSDHELCSGYHNDHVTSPSQLNVGNDVGSHGQGLSSWLLSCDASAATERDLPVTLKVPFHLPLWLKQLASVPDCEEGKKP